MRLTVQKQPTETWPAWPPDGCKSHALYGVHIKRSYICAIKPRKFLWEWGLALGLGLSLSLGESCTLWILERDTGNQTFFSSWLLDFWQWCLFLQCLPYCSSHQSQSKRQWSGYTQEPALGEKGCDAALWVTADTISSCPSHELQSRANCHQVWGAPGELRIPAYLLS